MRFEIHKDANNYDSLYYMPYDLLNFEILDIDREPPEVINFYMVDLSRTYMYFRISTSESVYAFHMLTLKGTDLPSSVELIQPELRVPLGTRTNVTERYNFNSSYQSPVTTNFIYYDTYLWFEGLEEYTDYLLYFTVRDLTGNVGSVYSFPFRTLAKQLPCQFKLRFREEITNATLLNTFGLITSKSRERFIILHKPP